jgi:ComF family protein
LRTVERTPANVCWHCGRPLARPQLCAACAGAPSPITRIYAVAYSAGVLRRAIHRLKYVGQTQLAEPLGALLADWWLAHPLRVDLLAPTPLHPARERQRGFNQATLLARRLSRAAGIPCAEHLVRRQRDTRPQVGLNARERAQNVAGAFIADAGAVAGRRILLIDDVCTTGATLEACATALRAAGAADVWGLVVARARSHATPQITGGQSGRPVGRVP